ncbi:farnesyl pyrophosphate synthase isoform X2 [Solenopsis invicta]|uniref:farnesyl pyrophosphate synthase isoform X2 n=1 Tax=Solenopsis invicta TaxID=13686 RepID=UPI00193DB07C|nr:farnesyl pyrophosphate synthase isoform X2 [Solenopsis invicta]
MEMTIAYLVMIDDIMDESLFRRGQPCWHRHADTGRMAINDALLIKSSVNYIITKHFKGKECYNNIVETFEQATFKTLMGQFLDISSTFKECNLDQFTMDRYNAIVKCKTEHGAYFLPTLLAMHFAEIKDPEMFKQTETILLQLGYLYQVQNDYLDCFGDFEVFGKDDTDIRERKCTWLIVKALRRVTPKQRNILKECYGVSDPEKVRRVKQLYIDLDLPNIYLKYEEETYNDVKAKILVQDVSCGFSHGFFLDLLRKTYRRRECPH